MSAAHWGRRGSEAARDDAHFGGWRPEAGHDTASTATSPLPAGIDALWERRAELGPRDIKAQDLVIAAVDMLDAGQCRVAWPDPGTGEVVVDERARRAIRLAVRLLPMVQSQVGDFRYRDRVPLTARLDGVSAVAGSIVRWGAYVAPGAVVMPSFVNIGAYVAAGTVVGTWATIGSCAQIGRNVQLAGGAAIGGVLEPPSGVPAMVDDEAYIGTRCVVADGARVRSGAVLGAGTMLTGTTHVVEAETGAELPPGEVPAWSVCVSGTRMRKFAGGEFGLPCVLVLQRLAVGATLDQAARTEILRDHGVLG